MRESQGGSPTGKALVLINTLHSGIYGLVFDLSLYGLVRRLKTSPAFRLVNDKSIDTAL